MGGTLLNVFGGEKRKDYLNLIFSDLHGQIWHHWYQGIKELHKEVW